MGVMIVLGTAGLFVGMMRQSAPTPQTATNVAAVLDEPVGTRIAGIVAVQERLAVQLEGGGPSRVLFVDPKSGAVTGRVSLAK